MCKNFFFVLLKICIYSLWEYFLTINLDASLVRLNVLAQILILCVTCVELITLVLSNINILSGAERQERSRGLLLCLCEREKGKKWDGRSRSQRSEEETKRRHLDLRFMSLQRILSLPVRKYKLMH